MGKILKKYQSCYQKTMDLLQKLDKKSLRDITRFQKSHMHDTKVDEVGEIKWTAEAMELVGKTPLKHKEKKALVIALHGGLAAQNTNGFRGTFNVGGAIEFVWDTDHQRYGICVHRKGCLAKFLPCCTSCSCLYDVDDNELHLESEPLPELLAPPSSSPAVLPGPPLLPDTVGDTITLTANETTHIQNTTDIITNTTTTNTTTNTTTTTDDDIDIHVSNVDGPVTVNLTVSKEEENEVAS